MTLAIHVPRVRWHYLLHWHHRAEIIDASTSRQARTTWKFPSKKLANAVAEALLDHPRTIAVSVTTIGP